MNSLEISFMYYPEDLFRTHPAYCFWCLHWKHYRVDVFKKMLLHCENNQVFFLRISPKNTSENSSNFLGFPATFSFRTSLNFIQNIDLSCLTELFQKILSSFFQKFFNRFLQKFPKEVLREFIVGFFKEYLQGIVLNFQKILKVPDAFLQENTNETHCKIHDDLLQDITSARISGRTTGPLRGWVLGDSLETLLK